MTYPLYLITGFLGSGKTTLLGAWYNWSQSIGLDYVFLINEFSGKDVDGPRLRETGAEVLSIPGGSIFCTCLVQEFILHLSDLPLRYDLDAYGGVVIEASGMADPSSIDRLLRETGLDATYHVERIIALADPHSLEKVIKTLPAIQKQLEVCDDVLLNKVDLVSEEKRLACESILIERAPKAKRYRCQFGQAPFGELTGARSRHVVEGELATCENKSFSEVIVTFSETVVLTELKQRLQELPIHRAKGTLYSQMKWWSLDHVDGHTECQVWQGTPPLKSECVVITSMMNEDELQELARHLTLSESIV